MAGRSKKQIEEREDAADAETEATDGGLGSAADKVADAIIRGIRSGAFVPGQHLVEPDLTRRLGISRGSLREALKHLAAAGIVTLNRFRGAYIASLDRKSVLDLLEVLEPLARLAARLAAAQCDTDEKREMMLAAANATDEANRSHNRGQYLECRRVFYSTLVRIGGNQELERAMPLTRTDLFRAQIEAIQSEKQRNRHASGYTRIAKAVVDGNASAAERAVQKHFTGTRDTIEELPSDAFPSFSS
ncbi:GntR family transcriptional regulator [Novosphingobium sp. PS1R-30]|uniref:GntR family transcriptional regulator n=1 Tax=Novosphingobium anseongense TaxID=3133436 RepID=A0ABU8S0N1_9SPHN